MYGAQMHSLLHMPCPTFKKKKPRDREKEVAYKLARGQTRKRCRDNWVADSPDSPTTLKYSAIARRLFSS